MAQKQLINRKRGIIGAIIAGIIVLIFSAIRFAWPWVIVGIVGNLSTDLLKRLANVGSWIWIIVLGLMLVVCAGLAIYFWKRNSTLTAEMNTLRKDVSDLTTERGKMDGLIDRMKNMLTLDSQLLRNFPSLMNAQDRPNELRRILKDLLETAITQGAFAWDVQRGSILLPDEKKEYLKIWEHHQMPQTAIDRTHFYIGRDRTIKRGVAGESFIYGQIQVVHITQEKGTWKADDLNYLEFDDKHHHPAYYSFVTVPITVPKLVRAFPEEYRDECIAVVCFDSSSPTTFDSDEAKFLLKRLALRIAVVILTYQDFK